MQRLLPLLFFSLLAILRAHGSEAVDAEWRSKAEGGDTEAQIFMGIMCFESGDFNGAEAWYLNALRGGNKDAEEYLATLYDTPNNPKNDPEKAFKMRRMVADRGDSNSQVLLGHMYELGIGIRQSPQDAAKWYLAAAKQGTSAGASALAHLYSRGEGVREDQAEAYVWARVAEELQRHVREKLPEQAAARLRNVNTSHSDSLAKNLSPAKLRRAEAKVEKLLDEISTQKASD